eukprot:10342455-Ditylum_brightwellii.AAC.1
MGHTLLAKSIKSNTIRLYLKAAALLCEPRRLISPPISCCGSKSAWIEVIVSEQRRWEAMPNRQESLTVDMILFACNLVAREDQGSLVVALLNWLIICIYTGNRKSECTQKHKLVRENYIAIWNQSIGGDGSFKAFTEKDLVFLGGKGKHLYASGSAFVKEKYVDFMEIRYRFQKNKDNGQKIIILSPLT